MISKVFLEENAKLLQILEQGASRKLELDMNGLTLKGLTIIGLSQKNKMLMERGYFGIYLLLYNVIIATLYVACFVSKDFKIVLKQKKILLVFFLNYL